MQEFKCAHEDGGEILFQRLPKTDTGKAGGPGHTGLNVGLRVLTFSMQQHYILLRF